MNNTGTQPLNPALAGGSTALQLAKPRVRPTFSEELGCLARLFAKRPATLEGIIAETQGRGYDLLLVLMCLPFLIRPRPEQIVGWANETGLLEAEGPVVDLPPWHYGLRLGCSAATNVLDK